MSAKIIDGKILAAEVKACAAQAVRFLQERYGITPCLAVLLVGDDPASQVYVRGKANDCEACGIESRVIRLPAGTTQAELLATWGRWRRTAPCTAFWCSCRCRAIWTRRRSSR